MSPDELKAELKMIIAEVGASSPADMGKNNGCSYKKICGQSRCVKRFQRW
jgi:uncharacterized protein YqeY